MSLPSEEVKNLLLRFDRAKVQRANFEAHWTELSQVLSPAREDFTEQTPIKGLNTNVEILDSTGIHANELLSSGFFSLLTSPSTPWFMIQTENPWLNSQPEMKDWLSQCSKIMAYEIQRPQTGFTTALHEFYLEYGKYGNAVLFETESRDRGSLMFQTLPLAESYFCENDEGRIDTLIRRYWRTAYQLAEKFGEYNLPSEIFKELKSNNPEKQFEILHFIMPNRWAEYNGIWNTDLPYASVYIERSTQKELYRSGFQEMPFMAARFYRMPQEVYGRGPGSSALADLNMLQRIMETVLRSAQKMVDPPLQMPDQGYLNPPRTAPGSVNYYRGGSMDRIEPLQTYGHPEIGMDLIGDLRARIREQFFVDQLQLGTGPQMTATEVMQRTEEKLRLMGPVVGRASSELLSPVIVRSFGLLARMGKLPEPPAIIYEVEAQFKIVYISPIMKAQEQVGANNLTRAVEIMLPFMSTDPAAMQIFNTNRIARGIGDMYSIDPTWFNSDEELQALAEAQAEAQEQAMMSEQLKNTGMGINNLAGAVQKLGGR